LKSLQNVDSGAELYCRHHTIGVGGISQRELYNTAADSFEWLGILRHTAELDQL
jgi:hypothetical protein